MRKLITTILAFFYLLSATGVTVHMHYCMDKLSGWEWTNTDSAICSVCGMDKTDKDGNCCKDESRFVKNTNDQQVTEASILLMQSASQGLVTSIFEIPSIEIATASRQNISVHPPPGNTGIAIFIRNCVFRI